MTHATAQTAYVGIRTASARERAAFEKTVIKEIAPLQPTELGEMMSLRGKTLPRYLFTPKR